MYGIVLPNKIEKISKEKKLKLLFQIINYMNTLTHSCYEPSFQTRMQNFSGVLMPMLESSKEITNYWLILAEMIVEK